MGWFVWLLESLLCLAASYTVAARVYPDRGVLDRFLAAMLVDTTLILVAIHVCGYAEVLSPGPLAAVSTALFGAVLAVNARAVGWSRLREIAAGDLRAPARLARDVWRERELSILAWVPAAMAVGTCALMIWYYRSWTWDPAWYHNPKVSLAIQTHSLRWWSTPNEWTQANPQHVELLAVWNCIFPRDNRFDDSAQWPFLFVGAAVVAAWSRRVGASRALAASLGAVWIAMPPVYLQAHSLHVDVAWNSLFGAAVYFMARSPERRDRWMMFLAWGLFLGSKYTAIFHMALWSPLIVARMALELRAAPKGTRARLAGDIVASALVVPALGIWKLIQNFVHTKNFMYPFDVRIRALGIHMYGPSNPGVEYGSGADQSPTFFGAPNALQELLTSWYNDKPFYCPDVRSGGFGPVFRWLLVFAVVAVALDVVRGRGWRRALLPLALFVESLQVPVPYMTRFVLTTAMSSLVLYAIVASEVRPRIARVALALALVGLTWHGYDEGWRGYIVHPRYFERARAAGPAERSALQIDTFLWPTRWAMAREEETRGHVVAYDEGVHFLNDLFNHDWSSEVVFVSSRTPVDAYMRRIRALDARWVGVSRGAPAEAALIAAGAEFLFQTPFSEMAMYRMPRAARPR